MRVEVASGRPVSDVSVEIARRLYGAWVRRQRRAAVRAILLLLAFACVIYFLWRVHDLLLPFVIAFFLAALLDPVVTNMQRRGVSRGRAVGSIYLFVFVALALVAFRIVPSVVEEMQDFVSNINTYTDSLTRESGKFYAHHKNIFDYLRIKENPLGKNSGLLADVTTTALGTLKDTILGFAGHILWLIIIPLSLFYFLMDYQSLRAKLISFVPSRYRANVDRMSQEVVEIFGAYARSLTIVCAGYAIAATIIFFALGLHYALFIGMAAGVLYAVPYVGPALAIASAAVIALTMGQMQVNFTSITLSANAYAILVVVVFAIMHFAFDYGITPRVVGGSVGLHPLVNIFALMCGATLFGVWGMLLAVPVAASIQMLLIYFFPKIAEKPLVTPTYTAPTPDARTSGVYPE